MRFPIVGALLFVLYTGIVVYVMVMLGRIAGAVSPIAAAVEHMRVEMAGGRSD